MSLTVSEKSLTPMMRQYWDIKSLHQDKILLYRMGDFFEMFFDDAVKAAPILGIALTSRNKKSAEETPMCGVPHHSIAGNINKLLAQGLKVAICDQIEDPKTAKGIVKRAITRILTPGMVYDFETLDGTQAHYIACYENSVLSCVDATTGESFVFNGVDQAAVQRLLNLLPIVELVATESNQAFLNQVGYKGVISLHEELNSLDKHILSELTKSNIDLNSSTRLLSYIQTLGNGDLKLILKPFVVKELQGRMDLKESSIRHLELFQNSRGETQGSLFHSINRTMTSAGARVLRSNIAFPLMSESEINKRLDQVEKWTKDLALTKRVREVLSKIGDIERRLVKISQPQCNGRDLLAVAESAQFAIQALKISGNTFSTQNLEQLAYEIQKVIVEEPPVSTKQGHVIQKGISSALDELILLSTNSQSLLTEMENREREKTGISSLKIRYNNVFGYYIEITNTHKDKAPSHYMRKQTLVNAERFCTDELVELEQKVLSAQTRRFELEFQIFEELRMKVLKNASDLLGLANLISELDVSTAAAWLAIEKKYIRPRFTDDNLNLINSRHPVVEQTVKKVFTPNSVKLHSGGCLLLTGPNMAGKSTLMRQVGLIAIMAQSGFFVPADAAELPVFEHIFTRIGASDMLSDGLSTFMVEMVETSELLKLASKKSLLILDEIGRGTSTFDGMSLAQSILEHIVSNIGSLTFFATHYHELTSLSEAYPKIINAHMKVAEHKGEIQFLHTLTEGPAQKSYGIHVAKIAGLPASILKRAQALLKDHESPQSLRSSTSAQMSLMEMVQPQAEDPQIGILANEIKELQVMNLTPIQALQKIIDWQGRLQ